MIRRALASFACGAWLAGCQVFVPGELGTVLCTEEGAAGPPACPEGERCLEGLCVPGLPEVGSACLAGECAEGLFCFDPAGLGRNDAPLCTSACCNSRGCALEGHVCAPMGTARVCLPAKWVGRDAPGEGDPGRACDAGTDCRSGWCDAGHCADLCCSDADCAAFGESCRFRAGVGWMCAVPEGKVPYGELCEGHAACTSGLCVVWSDGKPRCSAPCCSSSGCGPVAFKDGSHEARCAPIVAEGTPALACAKDVVESLSLPLGAPCMRDDECEGGICSEQAAGEGAAATKACADVCCHDASCGAPDLFQCMPVGEGQGFGLQCARR